MKNKNDDFESEVIFSDKFSKIRMEIKHYSTGIKITSPYYKTQNISGNDIRKEILKVIKIASEALNDYK